MPAITTKSPTNPLELSTAGTMSPNTAAASIIPAAKLKTISLNLCGIFLRAKPIKLPKTVAKPTPTAVKINILIKSPKIFY